MEPSAPPRADTPLRLHRAPESATSAATNTRNSAGPTVGVQAHAQSRKLGDIGGQTTVFFVMVVAAAEVVVGLGIVVAILRRKPYATTDDMNELKG